MLCENLGSWVEMLVWKARLLRLMWKDKAKANEPVNEWGEYLKLKNVNDHVGQIYLRSVIPRMKFEHSMIIALPLATSGLYLLQQELAFCSTATWQLIVISVVIVVAYLLGEAYCTCRLLISVRKAIIESSRSG